jgi:hypothetical protein
MRDPWKVAPPEATTLTPIATSTSEQSASRSRALFRAACTSGHDAVAGILPAQPRTASQKVASWAEFTAPVRFTSCSDRRRVR